MSEKSSPSLSRAEQKKRSQTRFINYLFLRIILANPHPNETITPERRLSDARQALLGEVPQPGRFEINDDIALFHILAEKKKAELDALMAALGKYVSEATRTEWEQEVSRSQSSSRAMSRAEAETARRYPNQDLGAVTDRLRRKASRADFSNKDMADIEGLLHGNSPQAQLIEDLSRALSKLGIKTKASGK